MSYFVQNGDNFSPTPGRDSILETLPVGNYVPAKSMMGMFFQRVPSFTDPGKVYGNLDTRTDRILNTFLDRPRSTGVLFAGEKGSGKSLLARNISYRAYEQNIPTILVNAPWAGDEFSSLLADIEQPAIVLMDEFEKVYDREAQESVLTLLDGIQTSKKLFVLTVNDKYRIDSHMRNRPGRLYYALDFGNLEVDFVREYCEDNLIEQSHIETLVKISSLFDAFNFDMLKAIVEEMNRYKEDPFEVLELLNAKPVSTDESGRTFTVRAWNDKGIEVTPRDRDDLTYDSTPLTARGGALNVYIEIPNEKGQEEDELGRLFNAVGVTVSSSDVRKIDADKGFYEFQTEDGYKVLFTRKQQQSYSLRDLAY